ncbi:MAG: DUF4129 domain-containing protein, partial [Bdellovibrionaceae bacterium]|nr:DUF4129 domain-containing protein [Pseudobdellovibrionaceae bacterium]
DKSEFRSLYLSFMSVVDSLNYNWTMFLLNYDMQAQLEILRELKFSKSYIFFGLFGVGLAVVYLWGRAKNRNDGRHDLYPVIQYIENWAQQRHLPVKHSQTPLQMLQLVQQGYPSLGPLLTELAADYDKLVYQESKISVRASAYKKRFKRLIKNI